MISRVKNKDPRTENKNQEPRIKTIEPGQENSEIYIPLAFFQ